MDTSKLVVGQDVRVVSGCYFGGEGKVSKITSSSVDVELCGGVVWRFNKDGKESNGSGTFECGPWELEDREAEDAKDAKDAKEREVFAAWCERMFSSFYPRPRDRQR